MPDEIKTDEDKSLRDILEAAFDDTGDDDAQGAATGGDDGAAAGGGEDPDKEAPEKDSDKKDDATADSKKGDAEDGKGGEGDEKPARTYREPPSRWTKEQKEAWAKAFGELDPENPTHKQIGNLRDMIFNRWSEMEADYTKKTQEAASIRKSAEGVLSVLEPRRQAIEAAGSTIEAAVGDLLKLNDFASARPEDFVKWFVETRRLDPGRVAQLIGYKAQPSAGQQQSAPDADDPLGIIPQKYKDALAALPRLQEELKELRTGIGTVKTSFETQQRSASEQSIAEHQRQIQQWATETDDAGNVKRPHFEEVRAEMIVLMETGRAKDLQSAYESAVWANPTTRQQMLDSQEARRIAEREASERRKAAERRAAATPRPGQTATPPPQSSQGDGSLRSIIEAAFAEQEGSAV